MTTCCSLQTCATAGEARPRGDDAEANRLRSEVLNPPTAAEAEAPLWLPRLLPLLPNRDDELIAPPLLFVWWLLAWSRLLVNV